MRLFVSGSAPLLAETHARWRDKHRPRDPRALRHDRDQHDHLEPLRRRTACRARSAFRCRASACASPIPRPARSCRRARSASIEVKGPNVFKGYWRMPEKTASEFRADGFFITGDLGTIDADGYRAHRRPRQGPDHLRRLQRLSQGDRERDRRDCRRGRKRGDRRPASRLRRGRHRGRRGARRARISTRRRSWRRSPAGWRNTSSPSACSSSTSCRATPWARCRRRRCARRTRGFTKGRARARFHRAEAAACSRGGRSREQERPPFPAGACFSHLRKRSLSSPCRRPASPGRRIPSSASRRPSPRW